jgi:uncharacterized membrane protein
MSFLSFFGDVILVEYDTENEKPRYGKARGHYRLNLQIFLIDLFGILLLAVGGITGFNALLSFIFSAAILWKVYFPLLLKGYPPIPLGLAVTALLTAIICFSVGGFTTLGSSTFLGSMLGILLTYTLSHIFVFKFQLHGAVKPYAESLLYAGYYHLNLTHIFVSSIFIASSGAVMDLAMDIAASMKEIKNNHPDISMVEHIRAGLRVGKAVISTMTTTLLLAFSANNISMFLLFMAKKLPMINIFNSSFISAEILNILVGSFGLVTVAPFTAVIAGLLYHKKKSKA